MPACKCFMALGRCPIDELKARVAALEQRFERQDWSEPKQQRDSRPAYQDDYPPKLWDSEHMQPKQAATPSPAWDICPICGEDHDRAATPAQQPREGVR